MVWSGLLFRKLLVTNRDSSVRWRLHFISVLSHCSSLKSQKTKMPVIFPKSRISVYFGEGVYFKLKDRGSLF